MKLLGKRPPHSVPPCILRKIVRYGPYGRFKTAAGFSRTTAIYLNTVRRFLQPCTLIAHRFQVQYSLLVAAAERNCRFGLLGWMSTRLCRNLKHKDMAWFISLHLTTSIYHTPCKEVHLPSSSARTSRTIFWDRAWLGFHSFPIRIVVNEIELH